MKKISIFVFAAVLSFFAVNVFAQSDEARLNEILAKMEAADKKIDTAEITYTQEIFYSATKETQKITGVLKYKRPNSIFIVQRTPQEQRIFIDGKRITVFTPENSQAVVDNWKDVISGDFTPVSMINFGSGWRTIKKDHNINFVGEDEMNYIIEISPAQKKDWSMQLHIDKSTMRPSKAIVTAAGLVVTVTITDYKINQNIKKDVFKFTVPEGVEVIELN
ncbi:MAG: outer membrane lipoprotein carrier protein LolA [Endomicrobia bacterium]|nr:outer membrane lipoprotein carrier protein LolA [Endomicrobiia bacterium]